MPRFRWWLNKKRRHARDYKPAEMDLAAMPVRVDDPAIRTRRLDRGYYVRTVKVYLV